MTRRKSKSEDIPETKPDNSVKITIISTIGLIVTTLITALFAPAILKALENTPSPTPGTNLTLSPTWTSIVTPMTDTPVAPIVTDQPEDVFEENFAEGPIYFSPHEVDNDKLASSASITDGVFRWQITDRIGATDILTPALPVLSDFELETTLNLVYKSGSAVGLGVGFRSTDSGTYYFLIYNTQYHLVKYFSQEKKYIDLIPWTYSEAIKLNEPNRLRVRALGGSMRLFINDVLVANPVDDTFSTGKILIAVSLQQGDTMILDVKSFKVTVLTP